MKRRSWKFLVGLLIVVLAITSIVVIPAAMAQEEEDNTPPAEPVKKCEDFLVKVADNVGVSLEEMESAVVAAQLQMIDEAVAEGKLTEEQGEAIKQRIEERGACPLFKPRPHPGNKVMGIINRAVENDIITQEQADTVKETLGLIRDYLKENGRPDPANCGARLEALLDMAVENEIISQEQADYIGDVLEDIKAYFEENGGSLGFQQHQSLNGDGPGGMGNRQFRECGPSGGQSPMGFGV
jgi:hypothetical protein